MLRIATTPNPAAARIDKPGKAAVPAVGPFNAGEPVDPQGPEVSGGFLVKLSAKANLRQEEGMPRGAERKAAVFADLMATAETSQKPLLELAEQLKASGAIKGVTTLYSPNALLVQPTASGEAKAIAAFRDAAGVKSIYDNSNGFRLFPKAPGDEHQHPGVGPQAPYGLDLEPEAARQDVEAPAGNAWGVDMVGAPKAWEQGATGKGLVYGSIDTGTDFTHEALASKYRGKNADGSFSHDYNWFDMANVPSAVPVDGHGHGTHTTGSVLGSTPTGTTGVAPEAQWISVRGLEGDGVDSLLRSMQFMQAPTKLDGSAPDATKAPDVVGMSWWSGKNHQDLFHESITNLRSAGVEVVKSAGNNGPNPETISSPGQFAEVHSVAAVDVNGDIASFSSRGPSPLPHTGATPAWKPDFAAPGVKVVSSVPGNKYSEMSGTSMAQPHYSGALLSVLSKFPQLNNGQLIRALTTGASDVGAKGRDLEFGHGIINLPATLAAAQVQVNRAQRAKERKAEKAGTNAA